MSSSTPPADSLGKHSQEDFERIKYIDEVVDLIYDQLMQYGIDSYIAQKDFDKYLRRYQETYIETYPTIYEIDFLGKIFGPSILELYTEFTLLADESGAKKILLLNPVTARLLRMKTIEFRPLFLNMSTTQDPSKAIIRDIVNNNLEVLNLFADENFSDSYIFYLMNLLKPLFLIHLPIVERESL